MRRLHRSVHVLAAALDHLGNRLAGRRVLNLAAASAFAFRPGSVNPELVIFRCRHPDLLTQKGRKNPALTCKIFAIYRALIMLMYRVTHSRYGTHTLPRESPQSAPGVRQNLILSKLSIPLVAQPSLPSRSLALQASGTTGTDPNHAATSPCTFGSSECCIHKYSHCGCFAAVPSIVESAQ